MAAILVIEDDDFFHGFLEIVLSREGHDVTLCGDGETGLAVAVESVPDLAICELSMPKMSGYDVIRELCKIDGLTGVPVIALSARYKPKDLDKAFAAGADAFETKPVGVDRLNERVRQVLAGGLPTPGS